MKSTYRVVVALLFALPAYGGVVFEMETKDLQSAQQTLTTTRMMIDGERLKIDTASGASTSESEAIFRGDKGEMLIVNHQDKAYFTIDEQQMKEISAQINNAMASMEQALANIPEAQREQMKKMMQGRMPEMGQKREPSELINTGVKETINGFPCVKYEVKRNGIKEREMWVTGWNKVTGGDDVMAVFESLAVFSKELLDSLPMAGEQSITDPTFEYMKEINGFPVKTVEFADNGQAVTEATFKGSSTATFDVSEFEPPKKYKKREMMKQLRQ